MSQIKIRNNIRVEFLNRNLMPAQNYFVNAATVTDSYDDIPHDSIKKFERLFEGLIKEGHWNCLDHVSPSFYLEVPLFVRDHIVRSSESKFNVGSARYSEFEPMFYLPDIWYKDVKRKELGSNYEELPSDIQELITSTMKNSIQVAYNAYNLALERGVRKEQASRILPTFLYTKMWHTAPLSAWLHFLNLRTDKHAQYETRMVAENILWHLWEVYPEIITLWEKNGRGPINE